MIGVFLIVIIAAGVLLLAMVWGGKPRKQNQRHRGRTTLDLELVNRRWSEVEASSQRGESGLKGAITEADKLLDYVMRGQGASGETMAERLKRSEGRLSNKEAVWQAHKLRNHISHEVTFDLVMSQGQSAIKAYAQALRDLGALR